MRRRTQIDEIFSEAYDCRVSIVKGLASLKESRNPLQILSEVFGKIDGIIELLGANPTKKFYGIFKSLGMAYQNLLKWRDAIKNAEGNSERFHKAYNFHVGEALKQLEASSEHASMLDIAKSMTNINTTNDIGIALDSLKRIALPLPIHWEEDLTARRALNPFRENLFKTKEPETVVFIEFKINGSDITTPHIIEPTKLYDLSLEVRINRWPTDSKGLIIRPISSTHRENYQMPEFRIERNDRKKTCKAKGKMLIKFEQTFESEPLEFIYGVYLLPSEKNIAVTGNNRLSIRSDSEQRLIISGYNEADKVLRDIKSRIIQERGITLNQRSDFLLILKNLANIAGQALSVACFPGIWREDAFQEEIGKRLRQIPEIGSELINHPQAARGILDLLFRKLSIELKVEKTKLATLENALDFSQQNSQYTTGCDNRLGVLCILDCSKKEKAPGSIANDIGLVEVPVPGITDRGFPLILGTVIIRGNLERPSDYSN